MACKIKTWCAILVLLKLVSQLRNSASATPQVPCFFIFGDSLVDNGNNNNLATAAKANYRPFGIDFSNETTTGRFTNGRTTVDIIGELLGLDKLIPSFANARGRDVLIGVNYASGAAGIRDETGRQLVPNYSDSIYASFFFFFFFFFFFLCPACTILQMEK
ncbi:unnamed protein product [Dovyalis caffra]|uniref:GDSL esterase/lipase n=1 Tax=Dovyalis caffra TaxID=77055 RepID=A0AAV1R868_9ROSI|nr:unnamed protein product [Dovyalis caffra]